MEKLNYEMAELPPHITKVECVEMSSGKMNYYVEFETKDSQTSSNRFTIYISNATGTESASVPLTAGQMAGDISFDTNPNDTYYIHVSPTAEPSVKSKNVQALNSSQFKVLKIEYISATKIYIDYFCKDMIPREIDVSFTAVEASGASISRNVIIVPFRHEIDIKELGISEAQNITMKVSSSYDDNFADLILFSREVYSIIASIPEIEKLEVLSKSDNILCDITLESFMYAGAGLIASLYSGEELLYKSAKIMPKPSMQKCFQLSIPAETLSIGAPDSYTLRLREEFGIFLTAESMSHRLILTVPELESVAFSKNEFLADIIKIHLYDSLNYPHSFMLSSSDINYTFSTERRGFETITFPLDERTSIKAAFTSGKTRGMYNNEIMLKKQCVYVYPAEGGMGICKSQTPAFKVTEDIVVPLKNPIALAEDKCNVGEEEPVFKVIKENNETYILISKTTWNLYKDRTEIKNSYIAFIKKLELDGASVAAIREIRAAIAQNMPQSLEEFAYYALYFDNSHKGQKSTVELFPGLILEASFSAYQHIVDNKDSMYLNGYVAATHETFTVVDRDGSLLLDPFAQQLGGGKYVDLMNQPVVEINAKSEVVSYKYETAGAAAFIDLGSSDLIRPYVSIAYHSKFPRVDSFINPVMSRNPSMLSTKTFAEMQTGSKFFFEYNATNAPGIDLKGGYFRGRAQITPQIKIFVCGVSKTVTMLSTVGDIANEYGLADNEIKVTRNGCEVVGKIENIKLLPLYIGDKIDIS